MNDKLKIIDQKFKQYLSLQPIHIELENNLNDWFRAELTYSSNAIEGNTLTRMETAEILERGMSSIISGKPLNDQLEVINHAKALDYLSNLKRKLKGHQFITEKEIKQIHKFILSGINDNYAGKYRDIEILVKGTSFDFPRPDKITILMRELVDWISSQQEDHPIIIAANAHYKLVTIHPFIDGNGRTARLLMNLILGLNKYPFAIIANEDRTKYLESLKSAQLHNDFGVFYEIIEDAVIFSLDKYINATLNSLKK